MGFGLNLGPVRVSTKSVRVGGSVGPLSGSVKVAGGSTRRRNAKGRYVAKPSEPLGPLGWTFVFLVFPFIPPLGWLVAAAMAIVYNGPQPDDGGVYTFASWVTGIYLAVAVAVVLLSIPGHRQRKAAKTTATKTAGRR